MGSAGCARGVLDDGTTSSPHEQRLQGEWDGRREVQETRSEILTSAVVRGQAAGGRMMMAPAAGTDIIEATRMV